MKKIFTLGIAATVLFTGTVMSAELNKSQISKHFQEITKLQVSSVEESPSNFLYQLITPRGIFYASKDGKHIISGALHDFKPGLKNNTEIRKQQISSELISGLKSSFITFEAPNQQHEVVVFYDTSCGYCQKLHHDLSTYLAAGITVHYAAFPRMGIKNPRTGQPTETMIEMTSLWCSENQQMALNMISRGSQIPQKSCSNKIEEHFSLGEQLGVEGTPALYGLNGQLVMGGYASATATKNKLLELGL